MGGFGTWDLLARMPTSFAAGIPICGGADNRSAPLIAGIPLWVWHGANDGVVPTIRSRSMVEALRAAGGQPRYQELAGVDHFAWVPAFEEPTLLDWLFAQRRSEKPQKAEKPARSGAAKKQPPAPTPASTGVISAGQKLAFLGDSITQSGWEKPDGYVKLVVAGLAANDLTVEPLPAGISGQKSNDMLSRIDRDVLSRKPAVMTLSCGVNDVWHQERGAGIKLEDYRKNITAMLDAAAKAKVTVVIMTATPIGEALDNENNIKLAPYNAFLRGIARERGLPLADAAADLQSAIVALGRTEGAVTGDGVHMNALGNRLMARAVLRALGLDDAQVAKAELAWRK
jgi:lysophospholipase L1-like esterase